MPDRNFTHFAGKVLNKMNISIYDKYKQGDKQNPMLYKMLPVTSQPGSDGTIIQ